MLNFKHMKKTAFCIILFYALIPNAHASDIKVITLQNGAITSTTTTTPSQQLTATPGATGSARITATPEFQSMQNRILADPQVMGDIQQMVQDPEIMALLADPTLLAAIQSGNAASLQADPRIKKLSENPKVQALIGKLQAKP